ncbi:hypothetical protein BDZ91DRAFT_852907 [Kalaharituber pfeilii]|nr:hypothetical protein BDZ91DRAFT_852907 [Kalaharituber pfeilii]
MSVQPHSAKSTSCDSKIFHDALSAFRTELTAAQAQDFANTTLKSLESCISAIQTKQVKGRNMRNINRIRPFVDAMTQYGKVIEVFLNMSDFVAFVWGPMKFLLQMSSTYINCFDVILDEYEHLGECLPQFQQYYCLFQESSYMRKVLGLVYQDILEFHTRALKVLQRPTWCIVFRAAWKDLGSSFIQIREKLSRHKELIESQASLTEFEKAKRDRELAIQAFERDDIEIRWRRRVEITNWLAAADSSSDQERFEDRRSKYPGIGSWVLTHPHIQRWLDASDRTNTRLWLYGIPGAVIVEELEKKRSTLPVAVAYFYCQYRNNNKDTFNAVGRGILSQLVKHNEEVAAFIWEKMAVSGEMTLRSSKLLLELLEVPMKDSTTTLFVIIDGLDECEKAERKEIMLKFRNIAERIDLQSDGSLKPHDTDTQQYTSEWGIKIQKKFRLTDGEKDDIINRVLERGQGMFLYYSLVMKHLYDQGTKAQLAKELSPSIFPIGLEKAYERIVTRIYSNSSNAQKENACRILDLIVCARRPLKKYEIQAVFAMGDMRDRTVDFAQNSLLDDISDLCGSLIEVEKDNTIHFVHMTARLFLIERQFLNLASAESNLAYLCVNYLSFDCFNRTLTENEVHQFALDGYFSFQDYAAVYWFDHIDNFCSKWADNTQRTEKIPSTLEIFLQQQLNTESSNWENIKINHAMQSRFKCFEGFPEVYRNLTRLVCGAAGLRKATRQGGSLGPFTLSFLHLHSHIAKARLQLEKVFQNSPLPESQYDLQPAYGTHWFKCGQPTCAYFSEGFTSLHARDRHEKRHERLFSCTEAGCPITDFGCCTAKQLNAHNQKFHSFPASQLAAKYAGIPIDSNPTTEVAERTEFPSFQRHRQSGTQTLLQHPDQPRRNSLSPLDAPIGSPSSIASSSSIKPSGSASEVPEPELGKDKIIASANSRASGGKSERAQKRPAKYACCLCNKKYIRILSFKLHLYDSHRQEHEKMDALLEKSRLPI